MRIWLGTFGRTGFAAIVGLLCMSAGAVWAADSQCPTASGTAIPGTGSGCYYLDKNFLNFNVSNSGSSTGYAPGTGNVDFYSGGNLVSSGAGYSSPGTAGSVDGSMSSSVWDITTANTYSDGITSSGTVAYSVTSQGGATGESTPAPGLTYYINSIQLTPTGKISWGTGSGVGNGTFEIQIVETVCLDQTTTAGCPAAQEATITAIEETKSSGNTSPITTFSFSCTGVGSDFTNDCTATSGSLAFANLPTLAVSDAVTVTLGAGYWSTASVDLSNLENVLGEYTAAPEPSTFVLFGTALAALGAIRLTRRRG